MRIAVLLSGQTRTWARCASSHITLFPGHDVDFYLQAWEPAPKEELIAAYAPKGVLVEPQRGFPGATLTAMLSASSVNATGCQDLGRAKAMLSQWCGVQTAWHMAQERQYDAFVRLRYDALFRESLPGLLEGLGANECRVPFWRDDENGVSDHLAVMGPSAAKHYCGMFDFLVARAKKPRHVKTTFHFTRNLEQCLRQGGVDIQERAIPYVIVRSGFAHLKSYRELTKRLGEKNEGSTFRSIISRNHR